MDNNDVNQMSVHEALVELRDMRRKIRPSQRYIDLLLKRIKNELLQTGEMPSVDGVTITFVEPKTGYDWNDDKLLGYAAAHPEILNLRDEKILGPKVRIAVMYEE